MYANYFNVSSDYITKLFDENSNINRDDLDMMFMFLYTKKGYLKKYEFAYNKYNDFAFVQVKKFNIYKKKVKNDK